MEHHSCFTGTAGLLDVVFGFGLFGFLTTFAGNVAQTLFTEMSPAALKQYEDSTESFNALVQGRLVRGDDKEKAEGAQLASLFSIYKGTGGEGGGTARNLMDVVRVGFKAEKDKPKRTFSPVLSAVVREGQRRFVEGILKRKAQKSKKISYTFEELEQTIRTLGHGNFRPMDSASKVKEQALLDWMMQNVGSSDRAVGIMRRLYRMTLGPIRSSAAAVANTVGSIFLGTEPLPRSGPIIFDGFRQDFLFSEYMEMQYEIMITDASLCKPTPLSCVIAGDKSTSLRGGLLSSGLVEDYERLNATFRMFRAGMESGTLSDAARRATFGIPVASYRTDHAESVRGINSEETSLSPCT